MQIEEKLTGPASYNLAGPMHGVGVGVGAGVGVGVAAGVSGLNAKPYDAGSVPE
jgi:hypothetical protein